MRKLLVLLALIVVIVIAAVVLGRCSGRTSPDDITIQSGEEPTAPMLIEEEPQPTVAEAQVAANPFTVAFEGPRATGLNESILVEMTLLTGDPVGTFNVEVSIDPTHFQIQDYDTETPGVQAVPAALPEGAQVIHNDVNENGTLTFGVTGLGASSIPSITLAALPLTAISPGLGEIRVRSASASTPEGLPLSVGPLTPLMVEIQQVTTPTPVPQPTPTQGAVPTLVCPAPSQPGTGCPPGGTAPSCPVIENVRPGVYYRIQRGQNLFRLAQSFGTTAEAIAAANGIADVRSVPAGKVLYIPVCPPQGQAAYLVSTGDTVFSIARTFGMTPEQLAALNNVSLTCFNIQVGQWLILLP
ncbi:MAG: LysM peptidoglycan-binding domain-containing protein [Anaerolineales bacterium]